MGKLVQIAPASGIIPLFLSCAGQEDYDLSDRAEGFTRQVTGLRLAQKCPCLYYAGSQ